LGPPDRGNAGRIMKALELFGAPTDGITLADLSRPGIVFQIGGPPRRIDILTAIDGVDFDEACSGRLEFTIEDLRILILNRDHLIRNKKAAGRPKNIADLKLLQGGE
jgi:hypothetical protein